MACKDCGDYWVCEPGEEPSCAFDAVPPIVTTLIYLGRYRIDDGKWSVWRRGNSVSISSCEPSSDNGGAWALAGCLDFEDDGDYDVWRVNPGNRIKIERVDDSDCSECD